MPQHRLIRPLRILAAAVAVGCLAAPAMADAVDGRLMGEFNIRVKWVRVGNIVGLKDGATGIRQWTFTPACATGTCTSAKLSRQSPDGTVYTYALTKVGASYVGRARERGSYYCNGTLYKRTRNVNASVVVTPVAVTRVAGVDVVTKITTRLSLVGLPGGSAGGCPIKATTEVTTGRGSTLPPPYSLGISGVEDASGGTTPPRTWLFGFDFLTGDGASGVTWDFGDPASPANTATTGARLSNTTTHSFSAAGTYTVTATATYRGGFTATKTITVTVSDPPPPPAPDPPVV